MAYKGKFTPKNKDKYEGDPTNIIYRSMWERHCFRWCDENPKVKKWSSEEVVIPYLYEVDRRMHRYYMDLKIVFENKTVLVEIKPEAQTRPPTGARRTKRYISEGYTYVKNMNKWEAANEYAKDRGWEFQIWTEKTEPLKSMIGATLKPMKKLKPLPKYKRKKTK